MNCKSDRIGQSMYQITGALMIQVNDKSMDEGKRRFRTNYGLSHVVSHNELGLIARKVIITFFHMPTTSIALDFECRQAKEIKKLTVMMKDTELNRVIKRTTETGGRVSFYAENFYF